MSQNLYFSFRILEFCLFLALFGIRSKSVLAFAARFLGSRLTSVVIHDGKGRPRLDRCDEVEILLGMGSALQICCLVGRRHHLMCDLRLSLLQ
jgi:hypothetical protein